MTKTTKQNLISFFSSLGLLLMISLIAGIPPVGEFVFGHSMVLLVAGISFCLLTLWRLTKAENKKATILFITLPPALIFIPVHALYFEATLVSLASGVFHFVGILFGALIFHAQSIYKKGALMAGLISGCIIMYGWGNEILLHKWSYGTFLGEVSMPAPRFELTDEAGNTYSNDDFKNKTLVMDFWTTSCGVCFRKFPQLELLSAKARDRSEVIVVAVNNQFSNDTKEKAIRLIRERGYTFKILFADLKASNRDFEFNAYPVTFIIKNGSKIVYKGGIENVGGNLGLE